MARQTPNDCFFDEDVIEDQIFYLPSRRKIIFTRGRKLQNNNCASLTVGQKTPCGKRCNGDYCKVHSERIIYGNKPIPTPCKLCGKGVKSKIQLCNACSREKK